MAKSSKCSDLLLCYFVICRLMADIMSYPKTADFRTAGMSTNFLNWIISSLLFWFTLNEWGEYCPYSHFLGLDSCVYCFRTGYLLYVQCNKGWEKLRIPKILNHQEHGKVIQYLEYHIKEYVYYVNEQNYEQEPKIVQRYCW